MPQRGILCQYPLYRGSPVVSYLRLIGMFAVWCLFGTLVGALLFAPLHLAGLGEVLGFIAGAGYCGIVFHGVEQTVLEYYGAELLDIARAPYLYKLVERVSYRAGVDAPVVYRVKSSAINAFIVARGERSAALAVTDGLLTNLSEDEILAVLSVLIARIVAHDILAPSVGAALASTPIHWIMARNGRNVDAATGAAGGLTGLQKFALMLIMPACSLTLLLAFDRGRVVSMDHEAAQWMAPGAIASALTKIEAGLPREWWEASAYNAATALLFVVPPLLSLNALPPDAPFYMRAQCRFPYTSPSPADRIRYLIGNDPVHEYPYTPGSFDYLFGIATPPPVSR
jgi:heat shock protein HtpX